MIMVCNTQMSYNFVKLPKIMGDCSPKWYDCGLVAFYVAFRAHEKCYRRCQKVLRSQNIFGMLCLRSDIDPQLSVMLHVTLAIYYEEREIRSAGGWDVLCSF